MPCQVLPIRDAGEARPFFESLKNRDAGSGTDSTENTVREILARVRAEGLAAVVDYTRRFDSPAFTAGFFAVSRDDLERAARDIPEDDAAVILSAAENIRAFHRAQKENSWFTTREDGTILGQKIAPVDSAGLYVPGGKGGGTPLISSMLMNAIPAQEAGVGRIVAVSPPRKDGTLNPYILAAAHLLGLEEVYAAGGAWAVAALAYGAGPLCPVDVIAGPGNIFVATAKRLLIGTVGIDMIAGPSEICIVADSGADPSWVAADMLSQAEHDPMAASVCICHDEKLGQAILKEVAGQCAELPRKEIAAESLKRYGALMVTRNLRQSVEVANLMAPEHLELMVAEPWEILPLVRHAGAVFMGYHSAEALGDYYAGPNHVLPTMGTARFSSALGVSTFCKKTSVIAASPAFAAAGAEPSARLARLEGLEAHAGSALRRKPG